jgi:hypothetical protein
MTRRDGSKLFGDVSVHTIAVSATDSLKYKLRPKS